MEYSRAKKHKTRLTTRYLDGVILSDNELNVCPRNINHKPNSPGEVKENSQNIIFQFKSWFSGTSNHKWPYSREDAPILADSYPMHSSKQK
jgi:hypothetical protein